MGYAASEHAVLFKNEPSITSRLSVPLSMSRIHSANGVPADCVVAAAVFVRGVPEEEDDEEDENEEKQGEDDEEGEGEEDKGEGYSE
jgi:hypothetical protein